MVRRRRKARRRGEGLLRMSDCTSPATVCHRREPRTLCRCALGSYTWHVASLPCLMPAEVWHHGQWEAAWMCEMLRYKAAPHRELLLKTKRLAYQLNQAWFYEHAVQSTCGDNYVAYNSCHVRKPFRERGVGWIGWDAHPYCFTFQGFPRVVARANCGKHITDVVGDHHFRILLLTKKNASK